MDTMENPQQEGRKENKLPQPPVVPPPGLEQDIPQRTPVKPIRAPMVKKLKGTGKGDGKGHPRCLIPLYPSSKWGVPNPKIHKYWREQEIKAKEQRLLRMTVPKCSVPWTALPKMTEPQTHKMGELTTMVEKKGKGPTKSNQLKIIKVIQRKQKNQGAPGKSGNGGVCNQEGVTSKEEKEVQTEETLEEQPQQAKSAETPQLPMTSDGQDGEEWEICEQEWGNEGQGNQDMKDAGQWMCHEKWVSGEEGLGNEMHMESLEDTEGEE